MAARRSSISASAASPRSRAAAAAATATPRSRSDVAMADALSCSDVASFASSCTRGGPASVPEACVYLGVDKDCGGTGSRALSEKSIQQGRCARQCDTRGALDMGEVPHSVIKQETRIVAGVCAPTGQRWRAGAACWAVRGGVGQNLIDHGGEGAADGLKALVGRLQLRPQLLPLVLHPAPRCPMSGLPPRLRFGTAPAREARPLRFTIALTRLETRGAHDCMQAEWLRYEMGKEAGRGGGGAHSAGGEGVVGSRGI